MIDYPLILTAHYPGKQWSMFDSGYENLEWLDDSPKPTQKELDQLWEQTQFDDAYASVQRARQLAYQQTSDPLMAKYLRDEIPKQDWLDAVAKVQTDNPYPVQQNSV